MKINSGKKFLHPTSNWNISNNYYDTDFSLTIPTGNLFTDFCYTHSKTTANKYFSDIHQVNNKPIPLIRSAQIRILLKAGSKADISKLGIVEITKTGKEEWVGGTFKAGGLEAAITELGKRVWGKTLLSVSEAVRCLQGGEAE